LNRLQDSQSKVVERVDDLLMEVLTVTVRSASAHISWWSYGSHAP
jgi:hypothetical protein